MPTTRSTALAGVVVLLALALALAGCGPGTNATTSASGGTGSLGGPSGSSTAPPGPSTTQGGGPTTSAISAAPGQPPLKLDASSSGTYDVKLGQLVELTLSVPGMRWSGASAMPQGPLQPDPSPSPPVNGVLAIWTAAESGTVSISAVGEAACSAGVACPQYARLFRVTIVIS